MPVASAVAQQEISQQQSLTLMRNMMRLCQKKRASQASEPIHTVFQEKKAQQKRPTRAAGRR